MVSRRVSTGRESCNATYDPLCKKTSAVLSITSGSRQMRVTLVAAHLGTTAG